MKAVITGATGCVGRNLIDALVSDNWDITVFHRKSSNLSKLDGIPAKFVEVDLHDITSFENKIPEGTDAIFNVAANVSHWSQEREEQWLDNVIATRNLVEAALKNNVRRFIHTSTGAAARKGETSWLKSGYITSKLQSEMEVQEGFKKGLDGLILRLPIVVGKYDYNNYSRIFRDQKYHKFRAAFPGQLIFAHASDIARGHIQAFEKGLSGKTYWLGGEKTTWQEVFNKISRLVGVKHPMSPLPIWLFFTIANIANLFSRISRKEPLLTPELVYLINAKEDSPDIIGFVNENSIAEKELGYKARPLDEALKDCHEWMIESGVL